MKKGKGKNQQNCEHRYSCKFDHRNAYVRLQCVHCDQIIERKNDPDFFGYMVWLTNREEIHKFFSKPENKYRTWYPWLTQQQK